MFPAKCLGGNPRPTLAARWTNDRTTFDYYRRSRAKGVSAALLPVLVEPATSQNALTLVCLNGRRIEVPSHFSEDGLLRLVRAHFFWTSMINSALLSASVNRALSRRKRWSSSC